MAPLSSSSLLSANHSLVNLVLRYEKRHTLTCLFRVQTCFELGLLQNGQAKIRGANLFYATGDLHEESGSLIDKLLEIEIIRNSA